ncbi:MAG: S41 family peptidase [Planctomycetia bacterium]|nr:S41 family peptidase [Planctomycetia bacterium]
MRPTIVAWILAPLSAVALLVAVHVARSADAKPTSPVVWDEEEFAFVRRMVADTYVDELTEAQSRDAFYAAVDGYVRSLPDEYNDFIPPEEYRKWVDDTAGHYAGVGVKIDVLEKEGLKIAGLYPGGPAATAGLRIGEVITHVGGRSLAEVDLSKPENVRVLKGPVGSPVVVTVKAPRAKDAPESAVPALRQVTIVRGDIRPATVFPRRVGKDGRVGYLRISEFVETTPADFDRALDAMIADGVTALVVDLRGNGGGVLPATVRIADRFIRQGDIVRMTGRARNTRRTEAARADDTIPDHIGLVVLVDGHTASASEVFAGCIQDHRRGVVLGTRTYGKFLVQNITEVPGRDAAVKLTSARYVTPNGRSYARDPKHPETPAGLPPDVVVDLSAEDRKKLGQAFDNQEEAVWSAPLPFPDVPADWLDPQLARALELIGQNLLLQDIRDDKPGATTPRKG